MLALARPQVDHRQASELAVALRADGGEDGGAANVDALCAALAEQTRWKHEPLRQDGESQS